MRGHFFLQFCQILSATPSRYSRLGVFACFDVLLGCRRDDQSPASQSVMLHRRVQQASANDVSVWLILVLLQPFLFLGE